MNVPEHTPEELVHDPEVAVVMVTAEQWDAIQSSWRRTVRSLVWLVVVVLVVVAAGVGLLGWRSYGSQTRAECIARTQAIGLGDVAIALKGAPTDPARNARLQRASDELVKLRDVRALCG